MHFHFITGKRSFIFFFIASLIGPLIYFTAYYPGCLSPDSYVQWNEASGLSRISDVHPALLTLLIKLLSLIWHSPAVLILFNILLFAYVCGAIASYFHLKGIKFSYLLLLVLFIGFVPTNGRMLVTFWKDVTYAIGMLFMFFVMLKHVMDKNYIQTKLFLYEFIFSAIIIHISRHNGLFVIVCLLAILLLVIKGARQRVFKAALFISLFFFAGNLFVFKVLKAGKGVYGIEHAAARHLATFLMEGKLTEKEKQVLVKVMPEQDWRQNYSPYTVEGYFHGPVKNNYRMYVTQYKSEIFQLLVKNIIRHPLVFIKSELHITQLIWRPVGKEGSYLNTYCRECGPGVRKSVRAFTDNLTYNSDLIKRPFYTRYLFWSGGTYFMFYLLMLGLFLFKKRASLLILLLPELINCFSLALAVTSQDFRYMYSSIIIFPFVLTFILLQFKFSKRIISRDNEGYSFS